MSHPREAPRARRGDSETKDTNTAKNIGHNDSQSKVQNKGVRRYRLGDFGELPKRGGKADELPDDIGEGENKSGELSDSLRKRLAATGGGGHGDPSRVDSGIIKSMLEEGRPSRRILFTFTH